MSVRGSPDRSEGTVSKGFTDFILQLYDAGEAPLILKLISMATAENDSQLGNQDAYLDKLFTRIKRKNINNSFLRFSTSRCSFEDQKTDCNEPFSTSSNSCLCKMCNTNCILNLINESSDIKENITTNSEGSPILPLEDNSKSLTITFDFENKLFFNNHDCLAFEWDPLLLWFRPSNCCLQHLKNQVVKEELEGIVSIGCGSGLLEWLLFTITGIGVKGYEVNRNWWNCSVGPPTFIPHVYVDEMDEFPTVPAGYALLFCYFNNGEIFRKYLSKYDGSLVIIIGPTNRARYTDPHPLDLLGSSEWYLLSVHAQRSGDVIACYTR